MLSLAYNETKYLSSAASSSNPVSASNGKWSVAIWFRPQRAHTNETKAIWAEDAGAGDTQGWFLRFRDGHAYFAVEDAGNYVTTPNDLGAASTGNWHLAILEKDGTTLRGYLDNGSVVNCTAHSSAAAFPTTTVRAGTNIAQSINFTGFHGDIACVAAWSNLNLDATQRTTLWNGGAPNVAKMFTIALPFYASELGDNVMLRGPFASMAETGGTPTYASLAGLWGAALSLEISTVTSIPGCVAFWPFQDGTGVNPVDVVNGYVLQSVSGPLPKTVNSGVFGERALWFDNSHGIQVAAADCPAIRDIYGANAQISIVAWVRDLRIDTACRTIAGMWNEHAKRKATVLRGVGDFNTRQVVGHVCSLANNGGGSTNHGNIPVDGYNHEWCVSGPVASQWPIDGAMIVAALAYDSVRARAIRDGVFNPYSNSYGERNPFAPGDGGGLSGGAAVANHFSVGTRKLGEAENDGEKWHGIIAGVAVFNRALTMRELATLAGIAAPSTSIDTEPSTIDQGESIALAATVDKAGYTSADTTWTSDLQGVLGTGASISPTLVVPGLHTITAETAHAAGAGVLDRDTVQITVESISTAGRSRIGEFSGRRGQRLS